MVHSESVSSRPLHAFPIFEILGMIQGPRNSYCSQCSKVLLFAKSLIKSTNKDSSSCVFSSIIS